MSQNRITVLLLFDFVQLKIHPWTMFLDQNFRRDHTETKLIHENPWLTQGFTANVHHSWYGLFWSPKYQVCVHLFLLVPQVVKDRNHLSDQITAQHSTNLTPIFKRNHHTETKQIHENPWLTRSFLSISDPNKKRKLLLVPKTPICPKFFLLTPWVSHSKLWIWSCPIRLQVHETQQQYTCPSNHLEYFGGKTRKKG